MTVTNIESTFTGKGTSFFLKKTPGLLSACTISGVLLMGSAPSAMAVTVSADDQTKIDTFLSTNPVDGDFVNLGAAQVAPKPPIDYSFPGIDNYTPFMLGSEYFKKNKASDFYSTNENFRLLDVANDLPNWRLVTLKDLSFDVYTPIDLGTYSNASMRYVRELTVVYSDDQSEETFKNVIIDTSGNIYQDQFIADFPIEAEDPRFKLDVDPGFVEQALFYNVGYWTATIPLDEELPYETIVSVDEDLKTGEIVEDVAGATGSKHTDFDIFIDAIVRYNLNDDTSHGAVNAGNYQNFTADVIYADVMASYTNGTPYAYAWGTANVSKSVIPSTNRELRVGIDYTHFIAKSDGRTLSPTQYGLNDSIDIAGYKLVDTREEGNGDITYIYDVVSTEPVDPVDPVEPVDPVDPELAYTGSTITVPGIISAVCGLVGYYLWRRNKQVL